MDEVPLLEDTFNGTITSGLYWPRAPFRIISVCMICGLFSFSSLLLVVIKFPSYTMWGSSSWSSTDNFWGWGRIKFDLVPITCNSICAHNLLHLSFIMYVGRKDCSMKCGFPGSSYWCWILGENSSATLLLHAWLIMHWPHIVRMD